jgi:hypothetical protein
MGERHRERERERDRDAMNVMDEIEAMADADQERGEARDP